MRELSMNEIHMVSGGFNLFPISLGDNEKSDSFKSSLKDTISKGGEYLGSTVGNFIGKYVNASGIGSEIGGKIGNLLGSFTGNKIFA
ncbi:hypothetical protein B488_12110 [Liberibacter crescens BT-1]|uniref:Bacteriocin n=1 Tax=Liberibacter crescens (strain BT-1) TaxID=1215343 RepID=L0EX21_LIBCB|nr:hypothetical protein [Liberibacter crescens]AGA65203.1 hypothetical protein B488_12110 [Liberibacter crescens BT-1]AMC13156.1 hypothetical protein RL73_06130 [Liberibacter crescens]